jgi:hypothetical protein
MSMKKGSHTPALWAEISEADFRQLVTAHFSAVELSRATGLSEAQLIRRLKVIGLGSTGERVKFERAWLISGGVVRRENFLGTMIWRDAGHNHLHDFDVDYMEAMLNEGFLQRHPSQIEELYVHVKNDEKPKPIRRSGQDDEGGRGRLSGVVQA